MSYCRFGWGPDTLESLIAGKGMGEGGSNLYLYSTKINGETSAVECCACLLSNSSQFFTDLTSMLAHIEAHRAAGHTIYPETLADDLTFDFENHIYDLGLTRKQIEARDKQEQAMGAVCPDYPKPCGCGKH